MSERAIETAIVIRNEKHKKENITDLLKGKNGFEIRRQHNSDLIAFECCECGQTLITSYNHCVYLKHKPNSEYCILKDETAGKEFVDEINSINLAKESPRHYELKQKLIEKLKNTEGASEIESEEYKFNGTDRRKPDVFCNYKGQKIAFEIQLSSISQRYIFYRYNFYKELGIYLFWVLDDFSKLNQNHRDRDIKYLNDSQNLFELNEQVNNPAIFICNFKEPFVRSRWKKAAIFLSSLYFDKNIFQAYYFDFHSEKKKQDKICFDLRIRKAYEDEEEREAEEREQKRLKNLENEIKKEKQILFDLEYDFRILEREKNSIIADTTEKRKTVSEPKQEIHKIAFKKDLYFSSSDKFINSKEEIKGKLDLYTQNIEKINQENRKIKEYQGKIDLITQFDTIVFHGLEYKVIDPKKYRQYIFENRKKFVFAYTSTLKYENVRIFREDKTNTLEKILSQSEKYSFLIILRQEVLNHEKAIIEVSEKIKELRLNTEGVLNELAICFVNWIESEIQKLEIQKQEISEELFRLNIQKIDTKTRIEKIEEKQNGLYYDE